MNALSASIRVEQIGNATLYCGDCRDVLPKLTGIDAVVTDPPYGVGLSYESHDDSPLKYDALRSSWFDVIRASVSGPIAISCGVSNLTEWAKPDWVLAWYKPNSMRRVLPGWNTWEPILLYGKPRGKKTHDCFVVSVSPQPDTGNHPCPKPLGWATELLDRLTVQGDIVLDPFMGSGTTGVACAKLGRSFVGIELDNGYFDIACRRIAEAQRQGDLLNAKPKEDPSFLRQGALFEPPVKL